MNGPGLQELERDVEQARARLLADLSRMTSPMAVAELKNDVREEARSTLRGFVEDLKGRAAANPAATLAVGAGLAWRLLRDPPIATALIGAGLLSLWRTTPVRPEGDDYLSAAKARLAEQAGDLMTRVGDQTAQMGDALKDNVTDMAEAATEKIEDWGSDISEEIAARTATLSHRAGSALKDASRSMNTVAAGFNAETRDALLLGAAGLAVAAALGIAYQRRSSEAPL